jgi:hypothetical protein
VKPATVDPKVKICTIEVGSVWTLMKLLPSTPAAITKVMKTGIQAQFANLNNIRTMARPDVGPNTYQLIALIPQKDTCLLR